MFDLRCSVREGPRIPGWFRIRLGPFGYTVFGRRRPKSYRQYRALRQRREQYAARYAAERSVLTIGEGEWLDRIIAFTRSEAASRDGPASATASRDMSRRFDAQVGPAPTRRTQAIRELMASACRQFESAQRGNRDGSAEGTRLLHLAGEQIAELRR